MPTDAKFVRLSVLLSESENLALTKIKHALEEKCRERLTTSEVIRELIKRSSK
jgi:hypothetical protein